MLDQKLARTTCLALVSRESTCRKLARITGPEERARKTASNIMTAAEETEPLISTTQTSSVNKVQRVTYNTISFVSTNV